MIPTHLLFQEFDPGCFNSTTNSTGAPGFDSRNATAAQDPEVGCPAVNWALSFWLYLAIRVVLDLLRSSSLREDGYHNHEKVVP